MLLSKTIKIKWNSRTRKYYELKGYPYTKMGDEFEVDIKDLTKGSHALVEVKCDCEDCENPYLKPMEYKSYNNIVREDGKYYCQKCVNRLFGLVKSRKTKLKNSISFYDWCYENLSKEEANRIMARWDYELNVDKNENKLTPSDVTYSSHGFNKKGYWFKCLDHPEHESELKSINTFINYRCGISCNQCNTVFITHPQFSIYLVNKEDAYKYSYGSQKEIPMICPDCGYEKKMSMDVLITHGFRCICSSSGKSYPEKFMFNLLEQILDNNFQVQLSKKTFKWCDKYRYDFYINNINTIVETHGEQHYIETKGNWDNLKEIQYNDKIKEQLAKQNDIINYIILDCRYSKLEWIKNSIMNSELPKLLKFKEDNIDWNKCAEFACNNLVKNVCNIWNNENNINNIVDKFKLHSATIKRYLKQGAELGWCNYNPEINNIISSSKKVICLNNKMVYHSISEASKHYNCSYNMIDMFCKGKFICSEEIINDYYLQWQFYDEYLINPRKLFSNEEINNIKYKNKKIICLTTNKIFNSNKEASIFYNCNKCSISHCCKGRQKSAGKHPETGEKLRWMYYDEYMMNIV